MVSSQAILEGFICCFWERIYGYAPLFIIFYWYSFSVFLFALYPIDTPFSTAYTYHRII